MLPSWKWSQDFSLGVRGLGTLWRSSNRRRSSTWRTDLPNPWQAWERRAPKSPCKYTLLSLWLQKSGMLKYWFCNNLCSFHLNECIEQQTEYWRHEALFLVILWPCLSSPILKWSSSQSKKNFQWNKEVWGEGQELVERLKLHADRKKYWKEAEEEDIPNANMLLTTSAWLLCCHFLVRSLHQRYFSEYGQALLQQLLSLFSRALCSLPAKPLRAHLKTCFILSRGTWCS